VTKLRARRPGVRTPAGVSHFSILQNVQTSSGAYPTSSLLGTVVLALGKSDRGMNLTTQLNLVPRLISGAIPLFHHTCFRGVDRDNFTFFLPTVETLSPRVSSLLWPNPRNPGQKSSVTLGTSEQAYFNKADSSSPFRRLRFPLLCTALYGIDGRRGDDPP
jgi:hypothetical protein